MAGAIIEVKYFNTFLLKKTSNSQKPIWNGSYGIPQSIGGYPRVSNPNDVNNWVIEESRIRGGYNNTTVDFGVKAYLVEEDPNASFKINSLIYSGIFNSRTSINQTNVFSVAEDITKSADPANGSIQKLYAENTNLTVFQELKVSRALIDKDAIYSAEGGGAVTSSNLVIGVIQPYVGEYGISRDPGSFAVYGYRKYFSDRNNNVILRLSRDGLEEISSYGMIDYFRDRLNNINTNDYIGDIIGGYDIYNQQYVISTAKKNIEASTGIGILISGQTLSFDERPKGWVSFFDYTPTNLFSLNGKFYSTVKTGGRTGNPRGGLQLWQHNAADRNPFTFAQPRRGKFYGEDYSSSVTFIVNPQPTVSKTFQTISYLGNNGWEVGGSNAQNQEINIKSDPTGTFENPETNEWVSFTDTISPLQNQGITVRGIASYLEGEYVDISSRLIIAADSATDTITITSASVNGQFIPENAVATAIGIPTGTTVTSFTPGLNVGVIVLSAAVNVAVGAIITIYRTVKKADYTTALGTPNPPLPRLYSGFNLKENKYVASVNKTGGAMSGIKGFYFETTLRTDSSTNLGGAKQLFSVGSTYTTNNGY